MPIDRTNTNNGRPLKPSLATTRTSKTPITPRLAANIASATTTQSTRSVRSTASTTPRAATASQEEVSTPVKSFLSSNVTPRSSSRKSRVGVSSTNSTPSSTPSVTPSSSRPSSHIDLPLRDPGQGYNGLGTNGQTGAQSSNRPRSTLGGNQYITTPTPRPPIANVYNHTTTDHALGRDNGPRFFHASDVRAHEPAPQPKKAPVFFYANGQQDGSPKSPSSPLSSVDRASSSSKFFHADSVSEGRGNSPVLSPPLGPTSPEPWMNTNPLNQPQPVRPLSPSKENIHLSYRKGASQVIRPALNRGPSALSILSGQSHTSEAVDDRSRRRSSVASSIIRQGHGKSASLSSIDITPVKSSLPIDSHGISSPLYNEKRVSSSGSLAESIASAPPPGMEALSTNASPGPMSPTKTPEGKSELERLNELAANARRERKVLDLEISNSSLLAINRQLEKEVRKQKAELRRFRRMSRAGRFPADSSMPNPDSFSAIAGAEHGDLSDMSEEEEKEPVEEEPDSSSDSSIDETTMSSSALAERDADHRLKDEKRIQLDLSKHRDLLVDSQKMNQSLKRCLNWTEELIKDAQKALAYQVRPSDVKLGGRVLDDEEAPEAGRDDSRALLSPWTPTYQTTDPLDRVSLTPSERTDRDSGIDVDGLKPMGPDLHSDISPLASPLGESTRQLFQLAAGLDETY
ncbi:hypothetical protein BU24DRAFT_35405 [Aaosphaeria arxii CBS 175.79]|uniref:Uncharacterized protein n=1 Tax=Aaosphaeria arxii CBS 175.79 TaxID=1450172 RepID=A0A6A5Y9S1_9PLEO|nr:uncharacterized protein BU24DRAFT_35405 [Aaosphaeria arxii CBS 175.79]KAF2022006.1 hypothetical protein BU24DRAFT_35405 [Aaosphaeria arxii CBS 175.79]